MANIIIFIMSCKKNKSKVESLKSLWLNACGFKYVIVMADPNLKSPFQHDIYTNELIVKCPDNYDSLSLKVLLGIKAIDNIFKPKGIFKIDDDVLIRIQQLRNFVKIALRESIDYAGKVTFDINQWSLYHQGRCVAEKLNNEPQFIPNVPYARGPIYYLSKKSIKVIIKTMQAKDHLYEDVLIGLTLDKKKIYPANFPFMTDILKEYLEDPETIALHDYGYNYDYQKIQEYYNINQMKQSLLWLYILIIVCIIFFII